MVSYLTSDYKVKDWNPCQAKATSLIGSDVILCPPLRL